MTHQLTLKSRKTETSDVESFHFEPEAPIQYQPGQFLHYTLNHPSPDDRKNDRYFTISAAPSEGFIQISTRFSPKSSTFKTALKNMAVGGTIEAEGPEGDFTYPNPSEEAIFIAGGIGITPFRSILVELDSKNINAPITLLYSNKTPEIPFKELIDDLAQKHDKLKVVYSEGKIDSEFIKQNVADLQKPIFYVSGPEPMVQILGESLKEMGIPETHIKQDFFPGYE